jgi:hypothetical protein
VFAWHAPGKPLETPNAEVLESGHVASGHTLKHLAAYAGIAVCMMLTRRMRIEPDLQHVAQPAVMFVPDRANS